MLTRATLILNLKELMLDLDRHYHTHLLAAFLQPVPAVPTIHAIFDALLYSIALTITNILAPQLSG